MKKFIMFLLVLISCKNDSKYVQDEMPTKKFSGYGIISFSKSYNGSIRYMQFYPILKSDNPDSEIERNIKILIRNGISIYGTNNTTLWQNLIKKQDAIPDEYGFCKALIYIELANTCNDVEFEKAIPNEVILKDTIFKTKIFHADFCEFKIFKFKIISAL